MRSAAEKMMKSYLRPVPGRQQVYFQEGRTMVIVESRQWKLSYSRHERVAFDVSDEDALFIELNGEEKGKHCVPWQRILRLTINEGPDL